MKYAIIPFDKEHIALLPQAQEPFSIIGKLTPIYDGAKWRYEERLFDIRAEKTYPDDTFDPSTYIDNADQAAFLAMYDGERIGSIRVCRRWNGNAFIDDLTVCRAHRRKGVGRMLMDAAVEWGRQKGLNGISLETQDNNLIACRFYIKYGFALGGIDTKVYTDPLYTGETALYFYLPDDR